MSSGDPFVIQTVPGNGNTWSYTAAANLVITGSGGYGVQLRLGAYATGVHSYFTVSTDPNEDTFPKKQILLSGQTLSGSSTYFDTYGIALCGIEL